MVFLHHQPPNAALASQTLPGTDAIPTESSGIRAGIPGVPHLSSSKTSSPESLSFIPFFFFFFG